MAKCRISDILPAINHKCCRIPKNFHDITFLQWQGRWRMRENCTKCESTQANKIKVVCVYTTVYRLAQYSHDNIIFVEPIFHFVKLFFSRLSRKTIYWLKCDTNVQGKWFFLVYQVKWGTYQRIWSMFGLFLTFRKEKTDLEWSSEFSNHVALTYNQDFHHKKGCMYNLFPTLFRNHIKLNN